jgi:hypothetical protein
MQKESSRRGFKGEFRAFARKFFTAIPRSLRR